MPGPSNSSGLQTSDKQVSPAGVSAILHSAILIGDGTNPATLVVYDGSSAVSGKELIKFSILAGSSYEEFHADEGVIANNGIYADVTGTGAAYIIHYHLA